MTAALSVIESRATGTANSGAKVKPQGAALLVVTVPGQGSSQTIQLVSSTALLMFRQALLYQPYGAASTTTPAAGASPSATATPSATTTPAASSSASAKARPSATSTAKTSPKTVPQATANPSPSPSRRAP